MKNTLPRRLAFKALRWWREMIEDLMSAEEQVMCTAQKLHKIAGRAHVLEMEAYGDTRPRRTLPPSSPE